MQRNILLFVITIFILGPSIAEIIVSTDNGQVRGVTTDKSRQFLGIPFAVPPTGNNRWRSPQPALPWSPNILNATSTAPACPQKYCYTFLPPRSCPKQTSEDCLYLNIWTPLDASTNQTYPVMVFIHGGAYSWGFAGADVYDGNNFVKNGKVILVSLDYRLGVLGFLYSGEGPDDAPGNMGIEDQRLALKWINKNIKYFGGDTQRITVFGQSAGAQSVFIHMMSNMSSGLFRNAIVESAPYLPYRTKFDALVILDIIARHVGCDRNDMKCLRSKSAEDINEAQELARFRLTSFQVDDYFEPFGPIIDGKIVPMDPLEAAASGSLSNIPVIMGTVTEECVLFVYGADKDPLPRVAYEAALLVLHPEGIEQIEKFYPPPKDESDCRDALSVVGTDYLFTCATRNVTRNIRDKIDGKLYRYIFDHASTSHGGWENFTFCEGHVCHAEELSYIFQNHVGSVPTEDDLKLSQSMLAAWTNFAYTSDPNLGPQEVLMKWPVYSKSEKTVVHFITPENELITDYKGSYCDFWDNEGYK